MMEKRGFHVKFYVKMAINLFGFAFLIGAVYVTGLTFYAMTTYGYFLAYESNISTLYLELALFIFSAIYLAYLIQKYVLATLRALRAAIKPV